MNQALQGNLRVKMNPETLGIYTKRMQEDDFRGDPKTSWRNIS